MSTLTSLIIIIFLLIQLSTCGIPIYYTTPVCTSTGGSFTMECTTGQYAIYDVEIGRPFTGGCNWNNTTPIGCSVSSTQSTEVMDTINPVFTRAYDCTEARSRSCEVTFASLATPCGLDDYPMIRVRYFCYSSQIVRQNGGELTETLACGFFQSAPFECQESKNQVNIVELGLRYLNGNCTDQDSVKCSLDFAINSEWQQVREFCFQRQTCGVDSLGSNGDVYGCATSLQMSQISSTSVAYLYRYVCQNDEMFTFPDSTLLPIPDTCVGMTNENHAVTPYGQFADTICWTNYTNCLDESIQNIQTCAVDEGFDENTHMCQKLASKYCSVGVPIISATALSDTEITITWSVDDEPTKFILTIDDPPSGLDASLLDNVDKDLFNYPFDGLTPNKEYNFSVSAVKDNFVSDSNYVAAVTYPENPTGFVNDADITMTSAIINYRFVYTASYVIIEGNIVDSFIVTPATVTDERLVTAVNLQGGVRYTVNITLQGMTGLMSQQPYTLSFLTVPVPPENLIASQITERSIRFDWDQTPPSDRWMYSVTSQTDQNVDSTPRNWTDPLIDITVLEPGHQYTFTISNFVEDKSSTDVGVVESTIPHFATFQTVSADHESVSFSWTLDEGRSDSFIVTIFDSTGNVVDNVSGVTALTSSFSGLNCGANYTLQIIVVAYDKLSSTVQQTFTTLPIAPENLKVDSFGTDFADISWDLSSCSSMYYLYQTSDQRSDNVDSTYTGSIGEVSSTNLVPGDTYTYLLRSSVIDHEGNVMLSIDQPRSSQVVQTLIPLPPLNPAVSTYSTDSFTAIWEEPSNGVYTAFAVTTNGTTQFDFKTLTKTCPNLIPGTLYYIEIYTYSVGSDSTQNSAVVNIAQRLRPNPPRNLVVSSRGNDKVSISFDGPDLGMYTGFILSAASSDGTLLENGKTISANSQTSFIEEISSSLYGDRLNVTIFTISFDETSETALNGFVLLHPADPVNFVVTGFSQTQLNVSWEKPEGLLGGYELTLSPISPVHASPVDVRNPDILEYSFTQLIPGTQYQLEICVYSQFDQTLKSLNCAQVNQLLMPVPPNSLDVVPIDKYTVNFTWNLDEDEGNFDGFVVFAGNGLSEATTQKFLIIGNLEPATNVTFSVLTTVSNATSVVRSANRSTVGWPYPDDVDLLTLVSTSAENGDVEVNLEWNLTEGGYTNFAFSFTSLPYQTGAQSQTDSTIFTTAPSGGKFSEQLTQNNIVWLVPGLHVAYSAVATYIDLQSQVMASSEFYIPPVTPVLLFVTDSRTTTSLDFSWSFSFANALAELFQIEYAPFDDTSKFQIDVQTATSEAFAASIVSLVPGQMYDFRVRSTVNNRELASDWSNVVTEPTFPEIPLSPGISDLILDWTKPAGIVESYIINVSDSSGHLFTNVTTGSLLNLNDSLLYIPGRLYTFEILSESNNLASLGAATAEYRFVPSDVTFTSVTVETPTSCRLQWSVPVGDVTSYVITVIPLSTSEGDSYQQQSFVVNGKDTIFYVARDLTPGAEYRFEIISDSGGTKSENPGSITARKTPLLSSVSISGISTEGATCSWVNSGIASSYNVSILTADDRSVNETVVVNSATSSYEFDSLIPGETYVCVVFAISNDKQSASLEEEFTLFPVAPTVVITYFGTTNLSASWSAQTGKVDGYVVILDGCRESELRSEYSSADTVSRSWDALTPGTQCRVRVWSVSNEIQSQSPEAASQGLYPATPIFGDFSASETTVTITWTTQGTATSFEMRVNGSGKDETTTLSGSDRAYTISGLSSTNEYTITLDAFSLNLKNWQSAIETVFTSPSPVVSANVFSVSATELNITWQYTSASSRVRYLITRLPNDDDSGNQTNVYLEELSESEFTDVGLTPGTDYSYEIVVRYSGVLSESVITSGYTYPAVPYNIRTEDLENDDTTLMWSIDPNFDTFRVNVEGDEDNYEIEDLETEDAYLYISGLTPGNQYSVTVESKYRDLYSQGFATFTLETRCYPIEEETATPWKIAFALTFVYAVIITIVCLYLAYLVYNGVPPKAEAVKPSKKYIITATPLDGTKWQRKYGEFQIKP